MTRPIDTDKKPIDSEKSSNPVDEQNQVMESFREFETSFRKKYPIFWLVTLLLPPVLSIGILVVIGFAVGLAYVKNLLIASFVTFFALGRFAIPLVDQIELIELNRLQVFAMISYMDLMVALIIPFHIGLLFRMKGIGPKISALVADGQFILSKNSWMKRASFLGLILFVMFPLAATGSVGGAIFARLLGMSRLASILGIAIGSLCGNGVMYAFAGFIAKHMNQDNLVVKYGGIVAIIFIIIVLERRYKTAKKRYLQSQEKSAET